MLTSSLFSTFLAVGTLFACAQGKRDSQREDSLAPGETKGFDHPPWLSSCKSIYLDVGSNLGVQIRKFFEPDKYPDAPVLPLFESTFGNGQVRTEANSSNCCLGIEPNPIHWKHLKSIELNYTKKGWHVHFYPYAAWKTEGTMSFAGHKEDVGHASWGAHLDYNTRVATSSDTQVRTVDLAAFIKSLPDHSVKLMKLDIEGAEYETVSHMISEKVLCQTTVEKTFMEVHSWGEITTWRDNRTYEAMQRHVNGTACNDNSSPTTLVLMDDETYTLDDGQRLLPATNEPSRDHSTYFVFSWWDAVSRLIT
jgi:FkbM family methyltransferase